MCFLKEASDLVVLYLTTNVKFYIVLFFIFKLKLTKKFMANRNEMNFTNLVTTS